MGTVVDFAQRQINNSNTVEVGEQCALFLSPQMRNALELISHYEGIQDIYQRGVQASSLAIQGFYSSGSLPEMMQEKKYTWDLETEVQENKKEIIFTVGNADFFATLNEEYDLPLKSSIIFFYEFFIQSFVDCYNGYENHSRLHFTPKNMKRKQWMSEDNQDMLHVLFRMPYIAGFTNNMTLSARNRQEFLDELAQRENIYTYAP